MSLTVTQARDEIQAVFRDAWDPSLPVLYGDVVGEPPDDGAWARIIVRHAAGGQATLANHEGKRRFRRYGTVTVQIFTPSGDGNVLSDQLVQTVLDAFEGTTTAGGVLFLDVRNREMGKDRAWFHAQVLADFQYDEVK